MKKSVQFGLACVALLGMANAARGDWKFDPKAKTLTDGTWTFAAELKGDKITVNKATVYPKMVSKLDFAAPVKGADGKSLTIAKLDTRFGRTGPDVKWARVGDVAAGFVGEFKLPGEGLEGIGDMAFTGCSNATGKITFPKTLKKIEGAAFCSDSKLNFDVLANAQDLEVLGSSVFEGDKLPAKISLPALKVLGAATFRNSNIKEITFGKNLQKIESGWGAGPFTGCRNLEKVSFDPESKFEFAGNWVFGDCTKLEELDLSMVTKWGDGAPFQRCRALRFVKLGKNLGYIPGGVFQDAHNIAEAHLYGAPGEIKGRVLRDVEHDVFGAPTPRNTMTTFVHLDPKSPTYAADLAAWGKCTAGGELKTTGSTWSEQYAGKTFKERPLLLWQKPCTVSITETRDASELNGTYGWFTISRADDDPIDITIPVHFDVGGTAKPGQTYCSLWGDVDIPAGKKSVKVKIRPLNDPKTTADATVVMTLKPHRYNLGAKTKATVTVRNGATYGGHLYADAGKWNIICHMSNNGTGEFKGNTTAAAKWCCENGFAFENDIQCAKTGVLYHDHDARKQDCPADWPDTFDKTIKCIPKGGTYLIDAKCGIKGLPAMIQAVKADKTCERALLGFNAWDKPFADMLHAELPQAEFWLPFILFPNPAFTSQDIADGIIAKCKWMNAKGVSLMWCSDVFTDELFAYLHAAGITIDVWTIDDTREIKEAVDRGARWVTTNTAMKRLAELPWAAEPVLENRKLVEPARVPSDINPRTIFGEEIPEEPVEHFNSDGLSCDFMDSGAISRLSYKGKKIADWFYQLSGEADLQGAADGKIVYSQNGNAKGAKFTKNADGTMTSVAEFTVKGRGGEYLQCKVVTTIGKDTVTINNEITRLGEYSFANYLARGQCDWALDAFAGAKVDFVADGGTQTKTMSEQFVKANNDNPGCSKTIIRGKLGDFELTVTDGFFDTLCDMREWNIEMFKHSFVGQTTVTWGGFAKAPEKAAFGITFRALEK